MTKQVRGANCPITLRRAFATAAVLLLFALVLVTPAAADGNWLDSADTSWYDNAATSATEYTISTAGGLAGLAELVNGGNTFAGKTIILGENIDLSDNEWPGIGVYSQSNNDKAFQGTFNGNGKTISGMTFADNSNNVVGSEANNYRGFFNQLYNAKVMDLTVEGNVFSVSPASSEYGGALIAGYAYESTIENCVSRGSITGTHSVAGIVVRINDAKIIGCTNYATVTGSYTKMGGIVCLSQRGESGSTITGCINEGTITSTAGGADGVGGIIGWAGYPDAYITITDCENRGTISATETATVGQIAAESWSRFNVFSGNKGLSTIAATGHSAMDGLNYAIVADGVATYVADKDLRAGNTYLVTVKISGLDENYNEIPNIDNPVVNPTIKLESGESITFDTSLSGINDITTDGESTITAVEMLTVTRTTNGNLVTYTADKAVATVGGKYYISLQEAIAEAKDGETIKLQDDVTPAASLEFNGGIEYTLDLNGYSLTYLDTFDYVTYEDGIVVSNGSTLNLLNSGEKGAFIFNAPAMVNDAIFVYSNDAGKTSTLNIKNIQITMTPTGGQAITVENPDNNSVEMKGNAVINVEDGTNILMEGTSTHGVVAIWLEGNGTLNLNGGSITIVVNYASYTSVSETCGVVLVGNNNIANLNKGTITVTGTNAFTQGVQISTTNGKATNTAVNVAGTNLIINQFGSGECYPLTIFDTTQGSIDVTGGSITGSFTELTTVLIGTAADADLEITGGSFSIPVDSNYLADGYNAVTNSNGDIVVVKNKYRYTHTPAVTTASFVENTNVSLPINIEVLSSATTTPTAWDIKVDVTDANSQPVTGLTYTVELADTYAGKAFVNSESYGVSFSLNGQRLTAGEKVDNFATVTIDGLSNAGTYTATLTVTTTVWEDGESVGGINTGATEVLEPITITANPWIRSNVNNFYTGSPNPWNYDNPVTATLIVENPKVTTYLSSDSSILVSRGNYGLDLVNSGAYTITYPDGTAVDEKTELGVDATTGNIIMYVAEEDMEKADTFIITFNGNRVGDIVNFAGEPKTNIFDVDTILNEIVSGGKYIKPAYKVYANANLDDATIDIIDADEVFSILKNGVTTEANISVQLPAQTTP